VLGGLADVVGLDGAGGGVPGRFALVAELEDGLAVDLDSKISGLSHWSEKHTGAREFKVFFQSIAALSLGRLARN